MSDYCVVSFKKDLKVSKSFLTNCMESFWDSFTIKDKGDFYELTINELSLGESLKILNKFKTKSGVSSLYVSYGIL